MNLKVFHKGLLLTGLPLLLELILIGSLLLLLFQSDREKVLETDYTLYSSYAAKIQALSTEAPYILLGSFQQANTKLLDRFTTEMQRVYDYVAAAKKLTAKHPELMAKDTEDMSSGLDQFREITNQIMESRREGAEMVDLLGQLPGFQRKIKESKGVASLGMIALVNQSEKLTLDVQRKQAQTRNNQSIILLAGVALNIALSIGLALFYQRSILRRIFVIAANTRNLLEGKELSQPLKGTDEIALLDHSFHSMHEQLREASKREKELFDNASDVICVLDSNERFSKVNAACQGFWGYAPDDMIGMSLWSLVAAAQKESTEEQILKTKTSKQAVSFESVICGRDGRLIEALWSAYWSDREQSLYCIVHDLTEHKRVERAKKEFLGLISSDLRAPLSSISTSVSKLLNDPEALPEKAAGKLDIARKNIRRLLVLVNDLLQLSEMDSGNIEIKKQNCRIDEVLRHSIQDVEAIADKSNIKLQLIEVAGEWYVDADRVVQVLVNLLSNAIKFSPEGATVSLIAEKQGDYILCKVIDRGRGVPASHLSAIFEKFKQVEAADGKRKSGTGLGLPICKQLVEDHGGTIGLDSEEGKGSTFWFRLPKDESASMRIKALGKIQRDTDLKQAIANSSQASGNSSAVSDPARPVSRPKGAGGIKLNLTAKGACLVMIPVAFELLFVGSLMLVLQQVDKERAVEMAHRMIAFDATKLMNCQFQAALTIGNLKTQADWWQVQRLRDEDAETIQDLQRRVKNNPEAREHMAQVVERDKKMIPFFDHAKGIMRQHNFDPHYFGDAFVGKDSQLLKMIAVATKVEKVLEDAESMDEESPSTQENLRRRQLQVLVGGLLANILSSLLLTVFFSKDITSRLMLLADNSARLANDKQLNPVLGGYDEIAELDRSFHHTAEVLAEARQKERAVFDNSQDLICAISPDGKFSSMNPACEKLLGYSKEEMKKINVLELSSSGDRDLVSKSLLGDFGTHQHVDFESHLRKKDGNEICVLWSASRNQEQSATFCIVRDISDRKELERLKQEFLGMVSHDLRTPLTSIIGVAKLIAAGAFGKIAETSLKTIDSISADGDRLLELINDLLDIEKLEAGKMQLVKESVEIVGLLEKSAAQSRGASRVKLKIAPDCAGLSLNCDKDRMIQALCNLINFSLDRDTSDKPVELECKSSARTTPSVSLPMGDKVEIIVRGYGAELSAQQCSNLFDRVSGATSGGAQNNAGTVGSGLALPIAKKVIESHSGLIETISDSASLTFLVRLEHMSSKA